MNQEMVLFRFCLLDKNIAVIKILIFLKKKSNLETL